MSKSARIEQTVQKMLFCFTNISAEILLHIFRLHFLHHVPYFGAFLPNGITILKASKIICAKTALL
jgi:hypothetical protein